MTVLSKDQVLSFFLRFFKVSFRNLISLGFLSLQLNFQGIILPLLDEEVIRVLLAGQSFQLLKVLDPFSEVLKL